MQQQNSAVVHPFSTEFQARPPRRSIFDESGTLVINPADEKLAHSLGAGFKAQGDLTFEGEEGVNFNGHLSSGVLSAKDATVLIGANACVEGVVDARRVFILGTVRGAVRASELLVVAGTLDAEGQIIEYGTIEVSMDATLNGNLKRCRA